MAVRRWVSWRVPRRAPWPVARSVLVREELLQRAEDGLEALARDTHRLEVGRRLHARVPLVVLQQRALAEISTRLRTRERGSGTRRA
eukprot:5945466-Prymnesium_polylepis.1